LHNETKHYTKVLEKKWLFSILDFGLKKKKKSPKKPQEGHNEENKFSILDGTKHNHENFAILYFIILM